jgi:hypothetical protein
MISEIDKLCIEIFQEFGGKTTISEKLRVDINGTILAGENHIIEISHEPSGIKFFLDEYPDNERNKLVGLKLLKNRLANKI